MTTELFDIPTELQLRVDQEIDKVLSDSVQFRHDRHKHPDLTWEEHQTSEEVAKHLEKIPHIEIETGVAKHGIVVTLTGTGDGKERPVVCLRSDMDALPIQENNTFEHRSVRDGKMHACGHDGHMANLLGAIRVLANLRDQFSGTLKFIFQPAEEGGLGADVMCEDGALKDPDVDYIFGLHGWPTVPVGSLMVKSGPAMASYNEFEVTVSGQGGHGAMPQLATDQILAAAKFVDAVQMIASRNVAPVQPVVLTIGSINGGKAANVIPEKVTMSGTFRTFGRETFELVVNRMKEISQGIAKTTGTTIDVVIKKSVPSVVNHGLATEFVERVAKTVLGEEFVSQMEEPTMGGEDFAFYLERLPGSFFFLGVDDGRKGGYPSLHDPLYDFNDKALAVGIKMFVHIALAGNQLPKK